MPGDDWISFVVIGLPLLIPPPLEPSPELLQAAAGWAFATRLAFSFVPAWIGKSTHSPYGLVKKAVSSLLFGLVATLLGTALLLVVFVLFGSPLASYGVETAIAAFYVSTILFFPIGSLWRLDWRSMIDAEHRGQCSHLWLLLGDVLVLATLAIWASTFCLPLDWQWTWQKWPIPCLWAAYLASLALTLVYGATAALFERG
ncbi:GPI biosynthesis protein family Pig-F-domain-containing protein [Polychytrium aggregatum]|uniref:GPI biosynthesis protein family Pig-F-domain-containing protein n=1 Tax=Polychytrium aggregatum TaxID=110093 RepID=UPI0022FEA26D|nr:GPI biosynthesis protein family Pig-F-domain-containing protein [Polychytrium aggregatum]KAI9204969.1 GPI biosynthesis protein family Pig-F-domain-containing protein [Polychytrium aggregatum]